MPKLCVGGAEIAMQRLAIELAREYDIEIISMTNVVSLIPEVRRAALNITCLKLTFWNFIPRMYSFRKVVSHMKTPRSLLADKAKFF